MRLSTEFPVDTCAGWTREWHRWVRRASPAIVIGMVLTGPIGAQSVPDTKSATPQPQVHPHVHTQVAVTEMKGASAGPTVAFIAGVHGGKVAAVHALDRLRVALSGRILRGRVLLVGPANAAGYRAGLAQVSPSDSLNLNRVFPGRADGRPTEQLAAQIMRDIVSQSDYLVDLHGSDGDEAVGRFAYAARPGVNPPVDSTARALAEAWEIPVIVWDEAGPRTLGESRFLQTAAHLSGVPAITVFEAGTTREDSAATTAFVQGALRVLRWLDLLPRDEASRPRDHAPTVLVRRSVVTAPADATWSPATAPGATLAPGEPAGRVRSLSGVEMVVPVPDGGLVLHLRKSGPVRAGTPLVITGIASTP
jgi:predicted deacylase